MNERVSSEELLALVETNHAEVLKNYQKAEKAMLEIPELKSQMVSLEQQLKRRGGGADPSAIENQSWGNQIVDSDQFKAFREGGGRGTARLEIKTVQTLQTSAVAGMVAPEIITTPVLFPRRRMTVRNLLAPGQTGSNSVWFSRMTARQNNAATVAELAGKPQSDASFSQIQTPVVTIAHYIQASRQAMDDAPALASTVDSELKFGLDYQEELQLLLGDGTGANLLGIVPQATAYSGAFTVTGETAIDRLALAILQSELAFLPASGIVVNATDWMKIKMLKDGMGRYMIGDPASKAAPVLWGLDVVPTTAISAGTFLVGAFETAAQIFDRMTTEILLSTEHGTNFTTNQITIRGEERLALAVKLPTAFITGSLP